MLAAVFGHRPTVATAQHTMTATAAAAKARPVNPYAKPAQNAVNMGRQSQQRVANQTKRKYKLCSNSSNNNNKKRKKGDQLTLQGGVAFNPEEDCPICKAHSMRKWFPTFTVPKRAHDVRCPKNTKTHGLGELTEQTINSLADNKRYKALTTPIQPSERYSGKHVTKAVVNLFLGPRPKPKPNTVKMATTANEEMVPLGFSDSVKEMVNNPEFREQHKAKGAPLAMLAFANAVMERISRQKDLFYDFFNGVEMEVPASFQDQADNPCYHSIVGNKLMYIDWNKTHGLQVPCPEATCPGVLSNDKEKRTNFSKNKTLFPIYGLDGSPIWCIVMVYKCPCCKRNFSANEGDVLVNLPTHAASSYPVDTTYAIREAKSHLNRHATEAFSSIMVTHGNGEMCSKLLYNAINCDYMRRIKVYYSLANEKNNEGSQTVACIQKDGDFIRQCPPLGETIRDMYDTASSSQKNPWCVSDHDRHVREIQSVQCTEIFAQDHAFQVTKNYQKKLGAVAAWDAATDTGEIACAVLVRATTTEAFAHAAQQLMRRPNFKPKVKYSDTWPNKKECWCQIIPGVKGRLGLFHYQQRIIGTLRKNHPDYFDAINDLSAGLYACCKDDYENLIAALKDGSLSRRGRKYTSEEISEMKRTRVFRDRYKKYLRKQLHGESTMIQCLDDWFCRYKVTTTDPLRPAGGRLDPIRMQTLFTPDTKGAIENCKDKAKYLSDALPFEDMYAKILPSPNSKHKLTECLSKRGESKLESFHDRFAHFANCGMRNTLADNLNLAGTARHNLAIRHKRSLVSGENTIEKGTSVDPETRKKIPVGWEQVVPYFNHSELWYINNLAAAVGCTHPSPHAEVLQPDNGERFFSEYMTVTTPTLKNVGHGRWGECLCRLCTNPNAEKTVEIEKTTTATITTTPTTTTPSPIAGITVDS